MAFLDRVKSFLPQKQLNTAMFQFFNPAAMPKMTERDYLRAYRGWVYAATNAIAERLTDIDLTLQTKTGKGWENIEEHDALDLVHKVNQHMSYYELTFGTFAFQELTGNMFWNMVKNKGGNLTEIWPLDPTRTWVVKDSEDYIGGYVFQNEKGDKIPFGTDEIIHFKRFNPKDPFRGMGTVEAAALPIDIDTYATEWQRNFFGNSAQPAGILTTDNTIEQEQHNVIKAAWDARPQGVANAH